MSLMGVSLVTKCGMNVKVMSLRHWNVKLILSINKLNLANLLYYYGVHYQ